MSISELKEGTTYLYRVVARSRIGYDASVPANISECVYSQIQDYVLVSVFPRKARFSGLRPSETRI